MSDPSNDQWSIGEVVRSLKRIESLLSGLDARFVSRGEYDAHTRLSDERHQTLVDDLKARRVSWPAVASAVCAVIAVTLNFVK